MWRNSRSNEPRLHDEPRRCAPSRGFTLLEAMVSLLLLVIVLVVAMTMLFQMRAFAERQQYFMLPRQAARRAADYLSFYFAGASDINYVATLPSLPSPNALIMYYNLNNVLTQASYNNLTGSETGNAARVIAANPPAIPAAINSTNFGDVGTDVITMVTPFNPGRYQVFAPFPAPGPGVNLWFNYRVACGPGPWNAATDAANLAAFKADTGFDGTQSSLLMLVDRAGNWSYVRIPLAGYQTDGTCADIATFKNIHVTVDTASPALPAAPNPTGAVVSPFVDPVYLVTGLQVISFRVLTDGVDGLPKLQQKLGLFDPATDNPGNAFTNVMENVEDLQVAYMYSQNAAAGAGDNPLVWNTACLRASRAEYRGSAPRRPVARNPNATTVFPFRRDRPGRLPLSTSRT